MMIPYLCPELPEPQKGRSASSDQDAAGLYQCGAEELDRRSRSSASPRSMRPGSYHSSSLAQSGGRYRRLSEPHVRRTSRCWSSMFRTPCQARPAGARAEPGRAFDIFTTTLRDLRAQHPRPTGRILGAGGFDPARDITAITVNRWPHGYAYEYNPLFDPEWPEAEQAARHRPRTLRPHRDRQFGRRRRGLYRLGDRPGLSGGAGIASKA